MVWFFMFQVIHMNSNFRIASIHNYNMMHEECRPGEEFYRNIYVGPSEETTKAFFNLIWLKSKRLGKIAYDRDGNICIDYAPVFVQKTELEIRKIKFWTVLFIGLIGIYNIMTPQIRSFSIPPKVENTHS